jgi:hypothetical protein
MRTLDSLNKDSISKTIAVMPDFSTDRIVTFTSQKQLLEAPDSIEPQSSPNVIPPMHNSETLNPLFPRSLYLMYSTISLSFTL